MVDHGTSWDITGHHGTSCDIMGYHGTSSDIMEHHGTFCEGQYGIIWVYLQILHMQRMQLPRVIHN